MIKIITNKIRCKECGEILESKHVHDWQCCKCFKESGGTKGCYVDGGISYLRRGGSLDSFEELSETRPYTEQEIKKEHERIETQRRLLFGNDYKEWA